MLMRYQEWANARTSISILGYCSSSPEEVRARLAGGAPLCDLTDLPGNYVIVIQNAGHAAIVMSRYSVVPYMYAAGPRGFVHGPTLIDVLEAGGMGWEWDFSALADLLCFGHLLGTETLHAHVKRTATGSVVTCDHGRLNIVDASVCARSTFGGVSPDEAVRSLTEEVARWWKADMVLCLSGGLDARLLLAALVAQGERPDVLVVGQDGSFDKQVATAIAEHFGLRIHRDEIRAADFIDHAARIIEATNGLLPYNHWPGVLLAARAPGTGLVLGWNGEFARSYYLDKGFLSLMLDRLPAGPTGRTLLRGKLRSPFAATEADRLHPQLADTLTHGQRRERFEQIIRRSGPGGLGLTLDEFFLKQYGTHKSGADVAAVRAFRDCILPFFASGWVDLVRFLPRRWKLGSRFHRYAIDKLSPDLMAFPEVRSGAAVPRTALEPSPFYWVSARPSRWITHAFNQSFYEDSDLLDRMGSGFESLAEVIDPELMGWSGSDPDRRQRFFHLAPAAIWYGEYLRRRPTTSTS